MKRFIDLGLQLNLDEDELPEFAFFCTVVDKFESFYGTMTWNSIDDFKADYICSGAKDLERYIELIPNKYYLQTCKVCGKNFIDYMMLYQHYNDEHN